MNLPGYDNWKLASPPEYDEPEDCPECGGEGFVFQCFDGCCEDADIGCDDCTRTCPVCGGKPLNAEPDPDYLRELRAEDRLMAPEFDEDDF